MKRCPKCKGSGFIEHPAVPFYSEAWRQKCDRCGGKGRVAR
jgi:DnaJ-class molecular chaperone